jgi:two-component SAPR family response regulator
VEAAKCILKFLIRRLRIIKVWIIDDEQPCLDELAWLLTQYSDVELIGMDTNPVRALDLIMECSVDAIFLDIDMPKLNGLELALSLQEKCTKVSVIFVTAYGQYALEAFKAHPLDFLLKPIRQEKLDDCIAYLRKHYALLHPKTELKPKLALRCFGTFELVCQDEIKWGTRRVRELLLYLLDRNGFPATKTELLEALFDGQEDKNTVHNLYMTIYRLKNLLDTLDPERKRIRLTEDNALLLEPGLCDFVDFMRFARGNTVITEENAEEAEYILSLFRGPYLEKENFEWMSENTYETEIEYERIMLGLGRYLITAGHLLKAERILIAFLKRNALCEEAHTLLLDLTLLTGSREAYLQRYDQYAHIMKKELRLKPKVFYQKQYEGKR